MDSKKDKPMEENKFVADVEVQRRTHRGAFEWEAEGPVKVQRAPFDESRENERVRWYTPAAQ